MEQSREALFRTFLLDDHQNLSRVSRFGINVLRLVYFTCSEFLRDRCLQRALELAYTNLFTLVPLTALFLFVSRLLGSLERWIDDGRQFIIGLTIAGLPEQDVAAIDSFIDSTFEGIMRSLEGSNVLVSVTSVVVLAFFSISLLLSIENVFNDIFGVRRRRALLAKITVFWLVLTASPLFLGLSMYMRSAIVEVLAERHWLQFSLSQWALTFLFPFAFSTAAFFILYSKMPFTRVRVGAAVVGAIIASALWEIAKGWLSWYVSTNVTYKNIYGTLGTVPVFLLFLYVTWLITLLGAELSYAMHHFNQIRQREILRHLGQPVTPEYLAVKLASILAERFRRGQGPVTADAVAEELELDVAQVEGMLERLEAEGLVIAVARPEGAFQLALAPGSIRIETVVRAAGGLRPIPPDDGRISELLNEMQQASIGAAHSVSVEDLSTTNGGDAGSSRR
ncbi:MAG: YhjD/YihY/BrkB family envelope integrity protein [Candidatus Eiseniibacteriota bacterium]|jgi:membrane protein